MWDPTTITQWKYCMATCHYIIPAICFVRWPGFNPKHAAKPMKEKISCVLTDDLPFFHSCRNYISKYYTIYLTITFNLVLPLNTYLHQMWKRYRVPLKRITCSNFPVPFVDLQTQPISDLDHWFQHQPLAHSLEAFWLTWRTLLTQTRLWWPSIGGITLPTAVEEMP